MTAYCQDEYYKPLFPLKGLFILLLVAIAGLFLFRVVTHPHSVARHGVEAIEIRKALCDDGPVQMWKARRDNTYYLCARLSGGKFGLQAIQKNGNVWHEKTAFVPKDGSWSKLQSYLRTFATRTTTLP